MNNTPETASNNPATAPKSPSDTRLKSLRTTLEQRWKEFDAATIKEAQTQVSAHPLWGFTDAISARNKDADYKKAKATFDEAMSALSAIKDDTALKNGLESPGRLASVMNTLKDYLANADKQKWYNTVLSNTFADLTTLRAQMTEKAEDKKDAEAARAALPVVTTTASVSPEVSAMGSEVNSMIKEWVNDATKAVTEEVTELKKHPARKIFELIGFTPEDTVSDIKSALSDLKDAKGFDKIGAKFSLFIAIFIGKILGVDFAKWLTPEEMKLAGIKGKVDWEKPVESSPSKKESAKETMLSTKDKLIVSKTSEHFIKKAGWKPYEDFLSALVWGARDATWGNDEKQKKDLIASRAKDMLSWMPIQHKKVSELIALKDDTNAANKLGLTGLDEKDRLALRLAIFSLSQNQDLIDTYIKIKYPEWRDMKTGDFLRSYYTYTGLATLEKVTEAVKDINWSEWAESIQSKFTSLLFSRDPSTWTMNGILWERFASLKVNWIDDEVLMNLIVPWTQGSTTVSDYRTTLQNNPYKNQKSQTLLSSLTEKNGYSSKIITMMREIGLSSYADSLGWGDAIYMNELISIYAIAGNSKNMDELSLWDQHEIIPILYAIAARQNPGAFTADSAFAAITGSKNKYTQRMSEFIGDSISDATYISAFTALKFTRGSAEAFLALRKDPDKSWIFYSTIWASVIAAIGVFYIRKPMWIAATTSAILIAGAKIAGLTLATQK